MKNSRIQFPVAEPYGLDVVHLQVAQGQQPAGERADDGELLIGGERRGPRRVHRFRHDPFGEPADVLLAERPLLAPEGDQRGQPYRPVHQARSGAVRREQLPHQRADRGGRESAAQDRRLHPPPPWSYDRQKTTDGA